MGGAFAAHQLTAHSPESRQAAHMQHTPTSQSHFAFDEAIAAAPVAPQLPSYIKGHRKRLRDRFLTGGSDAVPDYEVLELILFRAMPRQDVKPIAYALLAQFGDFNRVISASIPQLMQVDGVGEAAAAEIKIVEAAAHRLARSRMMKRHAVASWDALLNYCHTVMSHRETEQFRILFLDCKNTIIADEAQAQGTVSHVPVYPREVVKRALELHASALILVHNHPSGDPSPSQADIDMTHAIGIAAKALSITLHDHIIIGKSTELSFRGQGLL